MPNKLLILLIFTHFGLFPSLSAFSQVLMSEGMYEVPMADPLLKPFATLRLEQASLKLLDQEKNNGVVTYVLPRELTGRKVTVELKGTKTPGSKIISFKGDEAESTCAGGWANLQCNIAFDIAKLAIDERQLAGGVDVRARAHGGYVCGYRCGHLRKGQAEGGEAILYH